MRSCIVTLYINDLFYNINLPRITYSGVDLY